MIYLAFKTSKYPLFVGKCCGSVLLRITCFSGCFETSAFKNSVTMVNVSVNEFHMQLAKWSPMLNTTISLSSMNDFRWFKLHTQGCVVLHVEFWMTQNMTYLNVMFFAGLWIWIRSNLEELDELSLTGSPGKFTVWSSCFKPGTRTSHMDLANCLNTESPMKRILLPDTFWKKVSVTWVKDKSPSSETRCFFWKFLAKLEEQHGILYFLPNIWSLQVWLNLSPSSHLYSPSFSFVTFLDFRKKSWCRVLSNWSSLGLWNVSRDVNTNTATKLWHMIPCLLVGG